MVCIICSENDLKTHIQEYFENESYIPQLFTRKFWISFNDNHQFLTAKTNPEKAQLFAKSVERNFGIESHLFRKSHFDRINKFVEAHSHHFTPLYSIHDNITDTDDDSNLVADVDPDTLIC